MVDFCIFVFLFYEVTNLTHWGRVTRISSSKLTIICSDNGLSPDRRQAIIWTNAGIVLIGPLIMTFYMKICCTFSVKKMYFKMFTKGRPFCLILKVLICICLLVVVILLFVVCLCSLTNLFLCDIVMGQLFPDDAFNSLRPSDAYMRQ